MANTTVHITASILQPDTLAQQAKSGASWFFWIAGMSIFNSLIHLFGGSLNFVMGLGATQVIDTLVTVITRENESSFFLFVGLVIDFVVIGIFVLLGRFAQRLHRWAFVVGIVCYMLDSLIFLWLQEWFSLAFHAFVLYGLWRGWSATTQLRTLHRKA